MNFYQMTTMSLSGKNSQKRNKTKHKKTGDCGCLLGRKMSEGNGNEKAYFALHSFVYI